MGGGRQLFETPRGTHTQERRDRNSIQIDHTFHTIWKPGFLHWVSRNNLSMSRNLFDFYLNTLSSCSLYLLWVQQNLTIPPSLALISSFFAIEKCWDELPFAKSAQTEGHFQVLHSRPCVAYGIQGHISLSMFQNLTARGCPSPNLQGSERTQSNPIWMDSMSWLPCLI